MLKQSTKAILFFILLIPATGLFAAILLPQLSGWTQGPVHVAFLGVELTGFKYKSEKQNARPD